MARLEHKSRHIYPHTIQFFYATRFTRTATIRQSNTIRGTATLRLNITLQHKDDKALQTALNAILSPLVGDLKADYPRVDYSPETGFVAVRNIDHMEIETCRRFMEQYALLPWYQFSLAEYARRNAAFLPKTG